MMHMVITQEGEYVNLDNILRIIPQTFDFGDVSAYVLTAQPINVSQLNMETLDDCIQLGFYDSPEKLMAALSSFIDWYEHDTPWTFSFPQNNERSFKPFGKFVDGVVYWESDNGEIIKIGGSSCGKTRFFKKPDLMPMERIVND